MPVIYQVDVVQYEKSNIPPYESLAGSYEVKSVPGIRKHLAWIKLFCVSHGAGASISIKKGTS